MAEAIDYKYVGTRPVRPDGVDKVTGRAQFGADQNMPNMLYGKILRSPHAHAHIKRVDVSGALAIKGVYAAVSGRDFPAVGGGEVLGGEGGGDVADIASNVMARDKALYHGHAIAAVAATSLELAEQALDAIDVGIRGIAARSRCASGHGRERAAAQRAVLHEEPARKAGQAEQYRIGDHPGTRQH